MMTRLRSFALNCSWVTSIAFFLPGVASAASQTATFAAGCFWGTEEFFRKIPGVMETQVGYEGGKGQADYGSVSGGSTGYAETLQLKFDPGQVSYESLVVSFFKMHDPTTLNRQGNDRGTQYRSAIFTHTPEQLKIAEKVKARAEGPLGWKAKITTEIAPATEFHPAEEYHQKYLVKNPGGYDNHSSRKLKF
ncbi:MAG: peptide-methionine (S)-S-oxide reductase MsrA [Methylotenera sp.]|nr:peptide-methionine (S)-S-oxide reductase MsrA [Oligoflexia bacterium]